MPLGIDQLPYDVLFTITHSLDFEDVYHLSSTCRQLRLLLQESTLCRRTIETHVPYTREARLAKEGRISYREALQSVYDRRKALSDATPRSACVIGYASQFTYCQGILSYVCDGTLRILDVHSAERAEKVVNLRAAVQSMTGSGNGGPQIFVHVLNCASGVVVLHLECEGKEHHDQILAFGTATTTPMLLVSLRLENSNKLVARNTATHLVYGTHTGTSTNHNHREWQFWTVSLDPTKTLPDDVQPIQLEDFPGSDLYQTCTFEIHNDFFYALTNQTSFDCEEIDYTSLYHCIRFPVTAPFKDHVELIDNIYRRQHKEGPINDSWTDLSLQHDERTNELMIVEARREWLQCGSKQERTFYTQHIPNFDGTSDDDTETAQWPENDLYVPLITSENKAHYAPPRPHYPRYTHPEAKNLEQSGAGTDRSFMLARTKLRTYNLSCSAFMDVVEDERCCGSIHADGTLKRPCLRLRIGSRRPAPREENAEESESRDNGKGKAVYAGSRCLNNSAFEDTAGFDKHLAEESFRYSPVRMWPPSPHCSKATKSRHDSLHEQQDQNALLHAVMNPQLPTGSQQYTGNIQLLGQADERSLIYMVREPRAAVLNPDLKWPIVCVSFDKAMTFDMTAQHEPSGQTHREGAQQAMWTRLGMAVTMNQSS